MACYNLDLCDNLFLLGLAAGGSRVLKWARFVFRFGVAILPHARYGPYYVTFCLFVCFLGGEGGGTVMADSWADFVFITRRQNAMRVAVNVSACIINNLLCEIVSRSRVLANIVFLVLLMFLIFERPIRIRFRIHLVFGSNKVLLGTSD